MTGYQRLAVATCVATFILIIVGAVVRTTGSGLGCPDWPKCHGQFIPPFEKEVLIEYTHRLSASVVSTLVLATAAVAWFKHRQNTRLVQLAVASLGLLAFQVILGGVTVLNDLPPEVVTAHLATALALFAVLLSMTVLIFEEGREPGTDQSRAVAIQPWLIFGALALYILLLTGSYVVGSGASLVSLDWPLVNNKLFPSGAEGITRRLLEIQWLHRFSVLIVGLCLGFVAAKVLKGTTDARVRLLARLVVGLYVAQIFVGAANIWTKLSVWAASGHLAVGAAIWAALVVMFVLNRLAVGQRAARTAPAASLAQ